MKNKVIFVVDGEFMRDRIFKMKAFFFNGPGIREHCLRHLGPEEELAKILFYDATPFMEKGEHPISGTIDFSATDLVKRKHDFLRSLRETPTLAIRLGRTAWQQGEWQLQSRKLLALIRGDIRLDDINAEDITAKIRQKGVDMRLGIDIATIAYKKQAHRLVLITDDADFVPAVKLARREGITVTLDPLWAKVADDLREHVDYVSNRLPLTDRLPEGVIMSRDPKEFDPEAPPSNHHR